MLKLLQNIVSSYISVYDGISPSLLATISLGSCINPNLKSNEQLINSLKANNIIDEPDLITAMRKHDRKMFVTTQESTTNNKSSQKQLKNYYQNKPYKISSGQTMTDIFTHSVILNKTAYFLADRLSKSNQLRLLDIGTGHGYIAYILTALMEAKFSNQSNQKYEMVGIDTSTRAIQYSQKLRKIFHQQQQLKHGKLVFEESSIERHIKNQKEKYDVIIGGFYVSSKLNSELVGLMKQDSMGIWATDGKDGQTLFYYHKKGDQLRKQQIMATMFSQPTVQSSVSRYFHDDPQNQEENKNYDNQDQQEKNEQISKQKLLQHKRVQREEKKEKLQKLLKIEIEKYRPQSSKQINKKMSLKQMRNVPEIQILLQELEKIK